MQILDLSNLLFSAAQMQMSISKSNELDENFFRHFVLNSIKKYRKKFGHQYDELVIACDSSRGYWRKDIFKNYKALRKVNREKSETNWDQVFEVQHKIKQELKDHFPYKVIDVDKAEADDIIAALAQRYHINKKILILSSDNDNNQLLQYPNVKQYSIVKDKFIEDKDVLKNLFIKIIKGDGGDGIPNIYSPDDQYLLDEKVRQTSVTKKNLELWWELKDYKRFCDTEAMIHGFERNQKMIDYTQIPKDLCMKIYEQYEAYDDAELNKRRSKLFNFFIKSKLNKLISHIEEF